ncbi:MAG: hypothetical protein MI867_25150, partial [Pseudomonadales bacterium]|nr:hypothetical protein [Pseudomonadales bacterium]
LVTYQRGQLVRLSTSTLHLFKDELKEVTSKGGLFFLMGIFYALGRTTDNFVIGAFGSLEQVADFQILMRVLDIPLLLIMILTSILWSAFGEAMARGDSQWVIKSIQRISVLIVLVMVATVAGFGFAGERLISLWLGEGNSVNHKLFNVLAIWVGLVAFFNLLASYMNATNKLWFQVKLFAAYSILAFPIKILVLQQYSLEYFVWAGICVYLAVVIIPAALVVIRDLVSADERSTQPA